MATADEQSRRLFVAVPLPESAVPFAVQSQALLPRNGSLRLLDPGRLHCTLAFIGRADSRATEAARAVVAGVPAECGGEAALSQFLLLPTAQRVRVVALAVDDRNGVFAKLFETVMAGLEAALVMKREERAYRAHVTIARLREPGRVQPMSDCGQAAFGVESVCLYESELRRQGAVHTVLMRRDLR